ncbi:MAG: hypothetical protein HETSPECPRED_000133 [Heterodermia speciosa]|uniref:Uncharacterized protein n=1 Tax=Heterodermia speciosa TaxID=116794 RepID=A0A8H3ECK3_9LECA|nr:MAG: hypothetical protein HETSPECPRED_000133 [Heterodermia speciosa]
MPEHRTQSLLPQKKSHFQSKRHNAPTSDRCESASTDSVPDITNADSVSSTYPKLPVNDSGLETDSLARQIKYEQPTVRRIAENQSSINGRLLPMQKPETKATGAQNGVQRLSSLRREASSARTSRIATPSAPKYKTKTAANQCLGRTAHTDQAVMDTLSVRTQRPGSSETRASSRTHTEASLPSSTVTQSTRASSQIPPAPSSQLPPLSSVSQVPSDTRPARPPRPAFSTMQQHFTPKKAPKALTASFLAQPSNKELDIEKASAERASLQAELARLHLLHRESAAVERSWNESARCHFQLQFDMISKQNHQVKELTSYLRMLTNYPALADWSQGVSNVEFAEKLRILSLSILEISNFMSPESRYNHVLRSFQTWFGCAARILESRETANEDNANGVEFIEDLGDAFKSEVAGMERKLAIMSRELNNLERPRDGSSLDRVLRLLSCATSSLLEELGAISAVADTVMVFEAEWIREEARNITSTSGNLQDNDRRIWQ